MTTVPGVETDVRGLVRVVEAEMVIQSIFCAFEMIQEVVVALEISTKSVIGDPRIEDYKIVSNRSTPQFIKTYGRPRYRMVTDQIYNNIHSAYDEPPIGHCARQTEYLLNCGP
jgi:hypothetical protein